MDRIEIEIANKAFGAAQVRLRECKAQMNVVATAQDLPDDISKHDYLESEGAWFASRLERLYRTLIMVHEALGQTHSLDAFAAGFEALRPELNVVTFYDGDFDLPQSAGLDHLSEQLTTLSPLLAAPDSVVVQRRILWNMLEQTNVLMGHGPKPPTREKDVQDALEKALMLPFPDVVRDPPIAKTTKTYHPDFGIESLKTAIEVKFVRSKADVGKSIGELYEDMLGYNGSPTWSQFLAVVYMTGPYISQKRLQAELEKAEIPKAWRVCVAVGPGAKTESEAAATKAPRPTSRLAVKKGLKPQKP